MKIKEIEIMENISVKKDKEWSKSEIRYYVRLSEAESTSKDQVVKISKGLRQLIKKEILKRE